MHKNIDGNEFLVECFLNFSIFMQIFILLSLNLNNKLVYNLSLFIIYLYKLID